MSLWSSDKGSAQIGRLGVEVNGAGSAAPLVRGTEAEIVEASLAPGAVSARWPCAPMLRRAIVVGARSLVPTRTASRRADRPPEVAAEAAIGPAGRCSGAIEIEFAGVRMRITGSVPAAWHGRGRGDGSGDDPIASGVRVWIATGHTDMRRGMNTLALLVQEAFKRDPHGGDLYVFRGKSGQHATFCIQSSIRDNRLSVGIPCSGGRFRSRRFGAARS